MAPGKAEPRFYSVYETDPLSFCGPGDDRWLAHFVRDREAYEALFSEAEPDQLRGEASTDYLYRSSVAAPRLHDDAPSARVIFLLRDPALRAYSNWLQHVQHGREPLSFAAALDAEEARIEQGWAWWWHYAKRGYYAEQLEPFLDAFPSDQILILLHDDLRRDPRGVWRRACDFLEIEPREIDEQVGRRRNQSLVPRSRAHARARRLAKPVAAAAARVLPEAAEERLRRWYQGKTLGPKISDADYQRLRRAYRADLTRLAETTGLDVSSWVG
jgi:sulfotransferase family protein